MEKIKKKKRRKFLSFENTCDEPDWSTFFSHLTLLSPPTTSPLLLFETSSSDTRIEKARGNSGWREKLLLGKVNSRTTFLPFSPSPFPTLWVAPAGMVITKGAGGYSALEGADPFLYIHRQYHKFSLVV